MTPRNIAPRWYVAFALLLALGVGFRFYNLDKKIFWMDEAASALLVSGYSLPEVSAELSSKPVWSVAEFLKYQRMVEGRGTVSTLRALAGDDPHHTPLFYVLLRAWAGVFGDSIHSLRLLPVFLSLLAFPALWWLCRELFRDERHAGLISVVTLALFAISPFHIHYAQEARQYSFLTALFLFSSACLLRALRSGERRFWMLYGFFLVLGFYTHLLFVLMWLTHAAIVIAFPYWLSRQVPEVEPHNPARNPLPAFAVATLAMAIIFLPWALLLWQGQAGPTSTTSWVRVDIGLGALVKTWILNIGNLFLDVNHNQIEASFWSANPLAALAVRVARFAIFLLPVLACYSIWKSAPRRTAVILGLMILVPLLALTVPDIILGGKRSIVPRFIIPCYLGIQLAVGYYLATRIYESSRQKLWAGVLGVLLLAGIVSNVVSSQARVWWTKSASWAIPQVSEIVNRDKRPMIIAPPDIPFLALIHLLDPDVRVCPIDEYPTAGSERDIWKIRQAARDGQPDAVYFYDVDRERIAAFEKQGVVLDAAHKNYRLWKVKKLGLVSAHPQQREDRRPF